jgi:hypothetical protein
MLCFSLTTLHTAPLGRNFFFGAFQPNESMFLGIFAPDREWLGFVEKVTAGAYGGADVDPLDPETFIKGYSDQRAAFETHINRTGHIRVDPGEH